MITGAMTLEGVAGGFKATVEDMGESADVMLKRMQEGSAGMVKDTELMQSFNKAAQLIGKEFAGDLPDSMKYFRKIANSTGVDVNYLMDGYVDGIGRLSPMILDNLGIVVDLNAAYETWAKESGKTVAEMSKQEKQIALNAQVMAKLEENTANLPDVLGTAKHASEAFSVTWQNFKDKIGLALIPLFTKIVGNLSELADKWLPIITDWLTNKLIPKMSEIYDWFTDKVLPKISEVFDWIGEFVASPIIGFIQDVIEKLEEFFGVEPPEENALEKYMLDVESAIWAADDSQTEFGNNSQMVVNKFKLAWSGTATWFEEHVKVPLMIDLNEISVWLEALGKALQAGWWGIKSMLLLVWRNWGDEILDVILFPFKWMFAIAAAEFHFGWSLIKNTVLALISGDWKKWLADISVSFDEGLNIILGLFGTNIEKLKLDIVDKLLMLNYHAKIKLIEIRIAVKKKLDELKEAIKEKFTEMKDAVREKIDEIKDTAKEKVTELKTSIKDKFDEIRDAVKDKITEIKTVGSDWIQGLIDGITGKAQDLVNAVADPVRTAIDTVRDLLDEGSPSKVFKKIGANMMIGMEQGVTNASSIPVNAVKSVIPQLTGAAAGGMAMGGGFNVTITAPMVITAGSQYEAERILTPIIRNVTRKVMEGA